MFKKILVLAAALALTAVPATAQAEPGPALRLTSMLAPHRVLDVVPDQVHNNGGWVHMWSYHGGRNQQWYWYSDHTIRPVLDTTMCLDMEPIQQNGARLRVWKCVPGLNSQSFWLGTRDNIYAMSPRLNIDVNPNTNRDGGQVYGWTGNGTVQQQWWRYLA